MRQMGMVLGLAAMLAACAPGDTGKRDAAEAPPSPSQAARETFSGCTWGEVKGAGLSMWSYACGPQFGNVRLVADETLPGFVVESTAPGGLDRRTVVQVFRKGAEAPVESLLPAVRAASPGPATDTCALELAPSAEDGLPRWALTPTGDAKAAWEASLRGDASMDPPCGALGVASVGDRYFAPLADRPETVVFVELGSEIQIYDHRTLRATGH
jgi:hypothetical protein